MKRQKEHVSWNEIMADGLPRNDTTLNSEDYTLFLGLVWRTGEKDTETYPRRDDICITDSIKRYEYATRIVNDLLQTSENIKYYRFVRINFSTFESFGDGTGSSHICEKDIYIKL